MNIYDFEVYIFDFDGVIADSEKYHYHSYKRAIDTMNLKYNLTFEEYCKINHSNKLSFNEVFLDNYDEIYKYKKQYYNEYIENGDICLIDGFKDFYKNLLLKGKQIFLVTDSTQEIIEKFIKKYPFINTINDIISYDAVKTKKPNSDGYLLALQKIYERWFNNSDYNISSLKRIINKVIVFEDSLKGSIAANKVFYNLITVNDMNYIYFNDIYNGNNIKNFINIDSFLFSNKNIEILPFYISSKTYHKEKWLQLQKQPYIYLTSSWINEEKYKNEMSFEDKKKLCETFLNDIKKSKFGVIYFEIDDCDFFGILIEFGMLAALDKKVYIMGLNKFENEVFNNMTNIINLDYVNDYNVYKNILDIQLYESDHYNIFCSDLQKRIINNQNKKNMNYIQTKNNTKILDYVVIVACGEGTRLYPYTKNIPKLLVCINNESLLNKIVKYWSNYTNKFIIVIKEKYNSLINYYMKLLNIEYEIKNVEIFNGEENSYTIYNSLSDQIFINKKILITWCDIFPVSYIEPEVFLENNIIFTYKDYGRYHATPNCLIKKPKGNVIGIYYFAKFKNIEKFDTNMDICDCFIDNYKSFDVYEIDKLIDVGDIDKLDYFFKTNSENYKTRYFNNLKKIDNTFIKQSVCNYGNKVIENEMKFYKYHSINNVLSNIPIIYKYNENGFIMEYIAGETAYNRYLKCESNNRLLLLNDVVHTIENLHKKEQKICFKNQLLIDIEFEFKHKVIERINNVKDVINSFSFLTSVNNINIIYDHNYIINDLYNKIYNYFLKKENYYVTIHGDPHLSNIIISNDDNIYFIDPRGYFGKTNLFGLKEYDIGKILYSLSGFDYINNSNNFYFDIDVTNINIDKNLQIDIDNYANIFKNYNKDILLYMTILHWFGLTDYLKENVNKCITSYYYATLLYHKYLI